MEKTLTQLCSEIVGTNGMDVLDEQQQQQDYWYSVLDFRVFVTNILSTVGLICFLFCQNRIHMAKTSFNHV